MAQSALGEIVRFIHNACAMQGTCDLTDRELLARFMSHRDESAFTLLVRRHGPMVFSVCRRVLGDSHEAEDVFQATFLVLVHRTRSIRRQESVGSWLYGVAQRIGLRARAQSAARRHREREAGNMQGARSVDDLTLHDLRSVLGEEIGSLPEKYRAPIVLCYLEGKSHSQAAKELGWPKNSVTNRLSRARELLRRQLERRGIGLGAGALATALTDMATAAPMPALLTVKTVKAAAIIAAGKVVAGGYLSARASALAEEAIAGIVSIKGKLVLMLLAVGLTIGGAGLAGYSGLAETSQPALAVKAQAAARDEPAVGKREISDAVPPGAVVRLGSDHLRAMTDSLCFSDDGKTLVGTDRGLFRTWDAATGKLRAVIVRTLPVKEEGRVSPLVRTSDGKTLLFTAEAGDVEVWDVATDKQVQLPMPDKLTRISNFALSNDRRLLFLCDTVREFEDPDAPPLSFDRIKREQTLMLWNTVTKERTTLIEKHERVITLAIAPDGKRVASSGYKGTYVWDVTSCKALWHEAKFNAEELQFTSDSRTLIAAPGGNQNKWHVWDAATGKPAPGFIAPDIGQVWTFVLSADDNLLAAATNTDYVVCDLKTGKVLHRWPGANRSGQALFAPDGRSIVVYSTTMQRYDLATGKPLYADVATRGHTAEVRRVAFTLDGRRLVSFADDNTLRVWDPRSAELQRVIDLPRVNFDAWALTPDGKTLLMADDKLTIHRWSLADGKAMTKLELKEAKAPDLRLRVLQMSVSADGKKLAVFAWPLLAQYAYRKYSFSFWEAETGRFLEWGSDPGKDFDGRHAQLAPDGLHVAWRDQLYATTFPQRTPLEGADAGFVFSADSRLLASEMRVNPAVNGGKPAVADRQPPNLGLYLWEKASAGKVFAVEGGTRFARIGIVISPDGRWLGHVDFDRFDIYSLRDGKCALTGRRPADFGYRRGNYFSNYWNSGSFAFSPDGSSVVSPHSDGNMIVWALPQSDVRGKAERVGAVEAEALWVALKGEPKGAYAAHWRLRDDPDATLKLLRKRLLPVKSPPDAELQALIRALASEKFATRSQAMEALRQHGRSAASALRAANKETLPLEAKRRVEKLLHESLPTSPLTPEELRHIRATAILERLGIPEADRLLQELAGGAPEVRLTQEAQMALVRRGKS
jgi:RNA polymerase sigma factor (sigma-70 family)